VTHIARISNMQNATLRDVRVTITEFGAMNQSHHQPLPLIIAGMLLVFAVVANQIADAESNTQRHEACLRDRSILREQNDQWMADRAALHEQTARLNESRSELERHRMLTFELLRRLDELTSQVPTLSGQFKEFKNSQQAPAAHNERPISSLVEVIIP
jgi:hypothetical protein